MLFFFFFNDTATTEIYTLSLHDALPISTLRGAGSSKTPEARAEAASRAPLENASRSEEHTSELQSPCNLVCRLLLEKKKNKVAINITMTSTRRAMSTWKVQPSSTPELKA